MLLDLNLEARVLTAGTKTESSYLYLARTRRISTRSGLFRTEHNGYRTQGFCDSTLRSQIVKTQKTGQELSDPSPHLLFSLFEL